MPAKPDEQPQTLIHFTSGGNGKKIIETEVVKPGSASAQFLQRMEKNKQALPCHKVIDLRKLIKGDLFEYEYQGIIHFLDSRSIEIFENLLPKYHYVYTLEIYSIVSAAVQQQSISKKTTTVKNEQNNIETSDVTSHNEFQASEVSSKSQVTIIPFGYHRHQNEIRMLYLSIIKIQSKGANHWLDAKTINISVSGLKIKSPLNLGFSERQRVSIKFIGLNQKFSSDYPAVEYKIVDISHQDGQQICSLVKINSHLNEEFSSALSNFIAHNHKRYKIDLDDFIESIKARTFERIYSQDIQYPTAFIHGVDGELRLKHLLCNRHFKTSENNLLTILSNIADDIKIPPWESTNTNQSLLNIYSFTLEDNQGKKQLYCALDSSFASHHDENNFLGLAATSNDFKCWQLIIQPCQLLEETVANTFLSDLEEISIAESERLQLELETVVATAKIIDADLSIKLKTLNSKSTKKIDLNEYLCSQESVHPIEVINVAQEKQRNENRYLLTTAVVVKIYGKEYIGHTLDFSPNGIKLQLDDAISAEIRDSAEISFPGLQNKFNNENLEQQHFRIANISADGMTVCFSRDRRFVLHEASVFFRRLIDCNQHKLTQCSGDTYMVVRSTLFEKLMVRNLISIPFFITINNHIFRAEYFSANENPSSLIWSFYKNNEHHFDSIFSGDIWNKLLKNFTKKNRFLNVIFETEIYLSKNHPDDNWQVYLTEDFPSLQSLAKFIAHFKTLKHKKILRFSITPSSSYNQNLITDELHEIRANSIKQFEHFKEQLKNIKAVGELIDITEGYL